MTALKYFGKVANRPAISPKKKPKIDPKTKLESMSRVADNNPVRNLKCFDEIYKRICEGWPLTEVARFIQEVKMEAPETLRDTLYQQLVAFKRTIPPAEFIRGTMPNTHVAAVAAVAEGIDELAELEKLYRLQMDRIAIDVQNEKNIRKLIPTTGQEVRIAKEILGSYAGLKMDLGLSTRHIGQVEVNTQVIADVAVSYAKPEVQNVLSDPQSRKKVLGIAERLLGMRNPQILETILQSRDPAVIEVEGETTPVETEASPDPTPVDVGTIFDESKSDQEIETDLRKLFYENMEAETAAAGVKP